MKFDGSIVFTCSYVLHCQFKRDRTKTYEKASWIGSPLLFLFPAVYLMKLHIFFFAFFPPIGCSEDSLQINNTVKVVTVQLLVLIFDTRNTYLCNSIVRRFNSVLHCF
jgi:hypothetical protein